MAYPSIAIPGQPLGPASQYLSGPGTHVQNLLLCASILGPVVEQAAQGSPKTSSKKTGYVPPLPTLSVQRSAHSSSNDTALTNVLPEVGAVVLARVTRINPRQATVAILVVGETVCSDEFQGLIRQVAALVQDVRATERDKVKIFSSFRPGDIVRAQVISLGDQSNYYLATAGNHLGVVMATSDGGNTMYPISWKEFKDPVTGTTESRKVAKPF